MLNNTFRQRDKRTASHHTSRPTHGPRPDLDARLVEHYARRLRTQIHEERLGLPVCGLRHAILEANHVTRNPEDAVLDVIAHRLLAVFEAERHQPLPADASATAVEDATSEAAASLWPNSLT